MGTGGTGGGNGLGETRITSANPTPSGVSHTLSFRLGLLFVWFTGFYWVLVCFGSEALVVIVVCLGVVVVVVVVFRLGF